MIAWAVYHKSFEAVVIYAADTRGKAHATAVSQARDADYNARWGDFSVKRAPEFDQLAATENCRPYPLGYFARSYDLFGDFCGIDKSGCLEGRLGITAFDLYKEIGGKAE